MLISVHFPCFRAFCQLQTISAAPSRNLKFRGRSAVPSRATRGWLAVSRKPRCLRGIRAARGIPREPRGETGKAEACTSFAEFSAVLGEPRDDREGTELSHALHVSAGCSRFLVERARSAQRQVGAVWNMNCYVLVVFWYMSIPDNNYVITHGWIYNTGIPSHFGLIP